MILKQLIFSLLIIFLFTACESAKFEDTPKVIPQTAEEQADSAFEVVFRAMKSECKEQHETLVKNSKNDLKLLEKELKRMFSGFSMGSAGALSNQEKTNLVINNLGKTYIPESQNKDLALLIDVLASKKFQDMLVDTANLIGQFAKDSAILSSLNHLHRQMLKNPGDKLAEILADIARSPSVQKVILDVLRVQQSCKNLTNEELANAILLPKLILRSSLGLDIASTLGSPIAKHLLALTHASLKHTSPKSLIEFMEVFSPQENLRHEESSICEIKNLEPYRPALLLLAALLAQDKAEQPRPLRRLLNTLTKLYTMSEENQCQGYDLDSITEGNIKASLETVSLMIKDKEWGLVERLKGLVKPN